jgi:RNA polymerase sigma factor (sigma-70 family)
MSANPDLAEDANQTGHDPVVTDLVIRARNGDKTAWDALVEQYAPLIWSICARHQLGGAQAGDAGRSVWLQLADHLDTISEPAALAGWLAATTRRECEQAARAAQPPCAARPVPHAQAIPGEQAATAEQELLAAERSAALREAFLHLPLSGRRLITMLIEDPPPPYAQISAKLGIPAADIGPARSRCLDQLRRHPAIAALINAETETARCDAGPGPARPNP